ncbi:unnamed protein product [Dracunculus medinensis]|uniref:Thioredoxin-like_fold domain-containing protein n=1 Tax=Dracunculus medinensis TaxID=318479 RepID=A0A158Q456_DRAME|nr:unnamed protein product [Dracunculus medinensis]
MSFCDLYESCFKSISIIRIVDSNKDLNNSDDGELTVLDNVISTSKYILFYLLSANSERAKELVLPIKQFLQCRQENGTTNNTKSPPTRLRRFFGVGKKKHKKMKTVEEQKEISVIIFDVDSSDDNQQQVIDECGWYILAPMSPMTKSRFLRALRYCSTPSLIVVDSTSRQIITTDGRRLLQEDSKGNNFPWWNPTADELFQGTVLKNVIETDGSRNVSKIEYKDLEPVVKGIYFGAFWCPPCRMFTRQLLSCYESLKAASIPFEIFFCSFDRQKYFKTSVDFRSRESFDQHFSTMPWLAFDFNPSKLTLFTRLYNVNGIPALLILDEKNCVITRHGRNSMLNDPQGKNFPWGPQSIYELNEYTLCRLRDEPSLILFTEGSPEDVNFSIEVLKLTAEALYAERNESLKRSASKDNESQDENGDGSDSANFTHSSNSVESVASSDIGLPLWSDPLQMFYTGDDPVCDLILEGLGLADAELPLIIIVDVIVSRMVICTKPDVSSEIVANFVADYRGGKLEMVPLPSSCQSSPLQVGGIPIRAIHQALGIGNSPSQNSINNENTSVQVI